IGFPEQGGSTVTVNMGVVEGKDMLEDWIKTDARLIHGNSGGAAVDVHGKLIGIPTTIVVDSQAIDRDGHGLPDDFRMYGAVGFLRPAHLVAALLSDLNDPEERKPETAGAEDSKPPDVPKSVEPTETMVVRGLIRSSADGNPIAGARVGLVP